MAKVVINDRLLTPDELTVLIDALRTACRHYHDDGETWARNLDDLEQTPAVAAGAKGREACQRMIFAAHQRESATLALLGLVGA